MAETRLPRVTTPWARNGTHASRRASSVPTGGSKRPEWILDCVLMSSRKRKRISVQEESPSTGPAQSQGSRVGQVQQREQKRAPARATRLRDRSITDKDATSSRTRSRTRSATHASSSVTTLDHRPKLRAASATRTTSEMSPERSSSSQPRRVSSRRSKTFEKMTAPPRTSGAQAASVSRKNRAKDKGKGRALPEDDEMAQFVDDSWDARSSTSGSWRNTKRRRLSPRPSLPLDTPTDTLDGKGGSQGTAVEEDFQMLDSPESLPWIPMDPEATGSEYVPPGLNALIEDMKRALVLQMSARQKAENMHAEELQRRLELEQEAARLAAVNRALEAERLAWAAAAADTLASTLESALVSDIARRLTAEAFSDDVRTGAGPGKPQPGPVGTAAPAGEADGDAEMTEVAATSEKSQDSGTGEGVRD